MRATGVTIALVMLGVAFNSAAQEPKPATILQCVGTASDKGINAPADVAISAPSSGEPNTYAIDGNSLTVSGGAGLPDMRLDLCKSTSTAYTYSNDCTANRQAYIHDWLSAKSLDPDSPFFTRYKTSMYVLQVVTIDRVSLHVDDEILTGYGRTDYDKTKKQATLSPYLVAFSYKASCALAKPKI